MRGFKTQVWEGGIRVPFCVQWPGHLPAGKVYDKPVASIDILPTAVAAAGGSTGSDPIDGVDLTPYLNGAKTGRPHETLYWRFGQQWAIRKGDMKLVKGPQEPVQLFDLAADVGEQHDLAASKPEVVKELTRDYEAWDSQLMAPRWKGGGAARAAAKAGKGKGKAKAGL